jgi:hypothetical protein
MQHNTWESTLSPQSDLWNFLLEDLGTQILSGLLLAVTGKGLRKAVTAWRQRGKAAKGAQVSSTENP